MLGIIIEVLVLGNEVYYVMENDIMVDNKMCWIDMSGVFIEFFYGLGMIFNVIGFIVNGLVVDIICYVNGLM